MRCGRRAARKELKSVPLAERIGGSAFVLSHKKSGELTITTGQVEWRFGDFILQLGASKSGSTGLGMSGDVRHTWSPK